MTIQSRAARAPLAVLRPAFALLLATLTLCLPLSSLADPIRARVQIEIKQDLSLERPGLGPIMNTTPGLDTATLKNPALARIGTP